MSRRRLLAGAAGVGGSAVLAGCSDSSPSPSGADGPGSKEMTFLNDSDVERTPFGDAIKAFEKSSGISVTVQPVPSEYDTKFRTVLASSNPPDLIKINDDYVKGISKTGALLDLRPYIERDKVDTSKFSEALFNFPVQDDGSHTAWVIANSPRLIYYNKDAFKEAGVDLPPTTWTSEGWTWDDFVAAARKLTTNDRYGALIYLDTGFEQMFSIMNGSPSGIYSEDGTTFTLADPQAAEAVQWAADLTCKEKVQPPWGNLQSPNAELQLFTQGRLAMFLAQFSTLPYLAQNVKDFEFDVAPPPAGPAGQLTESSVVTYTIPAKAKNPDAAWELLKYLTSVEGGKILVEGNLWLPMDKDAFKYLASPPANVQLFAEAVNHTTLPNQTNDTLGARQIYRPQLDAVYTCQQSASSVLSEVKGRVEKTLQ